MENMLVTKSITFAYKNGQYQHGKVNNSERPPKRLN